MNISSQFIIETLLFGLAVLLSTYLYPAVKIKSFLGALGLALVLMLTSVLVVFILKSAGLGFTAPIMLLINLLAYAVAIWLMATFNRGLLKGSLGTAFVFALILAVARWAVMWLYDFIF